MDGSEIYECSYGCIEVTGSENVLFENSKFRDCEVVMEGFAIHQLPECGHHQFGNLPQ